MANSYSLGDIGTYKETIDGKTIECTATVVKNITDEDSNVTSFISVDAFGKVVEATNDNFELYTPK